MKINRIVLSVSRPNWSRRRIQIPFGYHHVLQERFGDLEHIPFLWSFPVLLPFDVSRETDRSNAKEQQIIWSSGHICSSRHSLGHTKTQGNHNLWDLTSRDGGLLDTYFTVPAFLFRMSAGGYVRVDEQQNLAWESETREVNIIYTYPRKDLCLASVQDPVVTHTSSCALATAGGKCETNAFRTSPYRGIPSWMLLLHIAFRMSAACRMWVEEDQNEGLDQKVKILNSISWSLVHTYQHPSQFRDV